MSRHGPWLRDAAMDLADARCFAAYPVVCGGRRAPVPDRHSAVHVVHDGLPRRPPHRQGKAGPRSLPGALSHSNARSGGAAEEADEHQHPRAPRSALRLDQRHRGVQAPRHRPRGARAHVRLGGPTNA
eukprot:2368382-Rhodomonas_salina.6